MVCSSSVSWCAGFGAPGRSSTRNAASVVAGAAAGGEAGACESVVGAISGAIPSPTRGRSTREGETPLKRPARLLR